MTDLAERTEALAQEIARRNPHPVGLQEVALFGGTTPATDVAFDYLQLLEDRQQAHAFRERAPGDR